MTTTTSEYLSIPLNEIALYNPKTQRQNPKKSGHDCNEVAGGVDAVAWMRMMGADSVAYHEATVMGRGDDFPGQALAYYASRGGTPLGWGGSSAPRLGFAGRVTSDESAASYGPRR